MPRWLKRILITLAVVVALAAALGIFVRLEGVQYVAAYTAGGFARPLPAADAYPLKPEDGTEPYAGGPLTVMTYNIFNGSALIEDLVERFADGDLDGMEPWSKRAPEIRGRIAAYAPDLIGLQEVGADADIRAIIPAEPAYAIVSYHLGAFEYGDSALLFRADRFELLESGQLWLGPHPDLPLAFGYLRLAVFRYINWAVLREKEGGFTFLFVNTHFDNNADNKEPSSVLFRERITPLAKGLPMVVTGDFNSKGTTTRYRTFTGMDAAPPLLRNTFTMALERFEAVPGGRRAITENDTFLHADERIDHILAGGPCPVRVDRWIIDVRPLANGKPMSDHDAIVAEFQFLPPRRDVH